MNPRIPADYPEVGRWLRSFATSHSKRESSRVEAIVEMEGARGEQRYGLRLVLGPLTCPPAGEPPLEFAYAEVVEGRTRFDWCDGLAERIRGDARRFVERVRAGRWPP